MATSISNGESGLSVRNKLNDIWHSLDLNEIASTIADTAVDVFVYDTRKDSDGGAWRKRTQHTSWYNETLNTATRGSRKEFPAVAVIVVEASDVTIYDGDDPDLPMWMVFQGGTGGILSPSVQGSCAFLNGVLVIGVTNEGIHKVDFIKDTMRMHRNASTYQGRTGGIVERNSNTFFPISDGIIVSDNCNDVAMTVLPNAPIDPATGLPIPTIAVATDGGVSVIKDDGTVVDSLSTSAKISVAFGSDYRLSSSNKSSANLLLHGYVGGLSDGFNSIGISSSSGYPRLPAFFQDDGFEYVGDTLASASAFGVVLTDTDETDPYDGTTITEGSVAYITSSYNTGWMNGDIKLATLSDTDDTDVTGSELVTNGTFDSDVSGWTAGDAASGVSYDSGTLLLTNNDNSPAFVGSAYFTTVVGKKYVFSFDVTARSNPSKQARILVVGQTAGVLIDSGSIYDVGSYSVTFTANDTSTQVLFSNGNQTASTGTFNFDNVSVRLAEEDRSVNGNGLQVFGSITKDPVATGADLVAYSGFSGTNYLEQPPNSDLQFSMADDFCMMGWFKESSHSGYPVLMKLWDGVSSSDKTVQMYTYGGTNNVSLWISDSGGSVTKTANATNAYSFNTWTCFAGILRNGVMEVWVNGELKATNADTASLGTISDTNTKLLFGSSSVQNLSLARISATAPTAAQIKKIYEDEKVLFQENAQATLYGSSDAVTALAYDDTTELLHVGTSAGRSVFQGLRRVDNTTTAVGAAISASNGLVAED